MNLAIPSQALLQEDVILVDENDNEIGTCEKLQTHLEGKLHRAVSVFLFNRHKQLLIQQRAFCKYHSGGLWSNTCCGHPRPKESPLDAAGRRLWEEMGIRTPIKKSFNFLYKAHLSDRLTEYEFDHVFIGKFEGDALPNPLEVQAWKWVDFHCLREDMEKNPLKYTAWLKLLISKFGM